MTGAQEQLCEALNTLSAIAWPHRELRDDVGEASLRALQAAGLIGNRRVIPVGALTACVVGRLVSYDRGTGRLVHRVRPDWLDENGIINRRNAESFADAVGFNGYRRVGLLGRRVYAHRVGWLLENGRWPIVMDHLNRDRADNRIENLRDTTQRGNLQNMPRKSQYTGVYNSSKNSFRTRVQVQGKSVGLGSHRTAELAFAAYVGAVREYDLMTEPQIKELIAMNA